MTHLNFPWDYTKLNQLMARLKEACKKKWYYIAYVREVTHNF